MRSNEWKTSPRNIEVRNNSLPLRFTSHHHPSLPLLNYSLCVPKEPKPSRSIPERNKRKESLKQLKLIKILLTITFKRRLTVYFVIFGDKSSYHTSFKNANHIVSVLLTMEDPLTCL